MTTSTSSRCSSILFARRSPARVTASSSRSSESPGGKVADEGATGVGATTGGGGATGRGGRCAAAGRARGAGVGVVKRLTELDGDDHGDWRRHAVQRGCFGASDQLTQRQTINPLHRQERVAVDLSKLKHVHDISVREVHRQLRFAEEELAEVRALRECRQDAFDHHLASRAGGARLGSEKNLSHSPLGRASVRGGGARSQPPAKNKSAGHAGQSPGRRCLTPGDTW